MKLTFKQLRKANIKRAVEWNKSEPMDGHLELLFRSTELGGEAGEVLNAVKKFSRHFRNMVGGVSEKESINNIKDELADVIICVDRVAELLDIDLEEATIKKFNKTSKKNKLKTKLK